MEPPVPIPNTVVKHLEVESTCLETGWEDRKLLVYHLQILFANDFTISNGIWRLW